MPCTCKFSSEYPNCDGTHKTINKIKNKLTKEVESIDISDGKLNALGMKMLVLEVIKNLKGDN